MESISEKGKKKGVKETTRPGPKSFKNRMFKKKGDISDSDESVVSVVSSIRTNKSEDSMTSVSASASVSMSGTPLMRRKRGRPVTTGEWEIKKKEIKKRELEEEKKREEEVADITVQPKSRATNLSRTEAEFVEEF